MARGWMLFRSNILNATSLCFENHILVVDKVSGVPVVIVVSAKLETELDVVSLKKYSITHLLRYPPFKGRSNRGFSKSRVKSR